jgi:hypothetical protein
MMMNMQPNKPIGSGERMEDLPMHPRILAERAEQERKEQERQKRAARRNATVAQQTPAQEPQTKTQLPQLSTAQRQRNQAGQPRETDGRYAEKSGSKWKHFLRSEPGPQTSLKRVKKPPVQAKALRSTKKRPVPMSAVEHRNPLVKARWWVTRGFRQWRRKKARQIRKAFSLRG